MYAGLVSRTCTAPFDRLKIFLITRPPDLGGTSLGPQAPVRGVKAIGGAIARIYAEGGVPAFWTGNGLSVMKILPESAIKFLTYESSVSGCSNYTANATHMSYAHLPPKLSRAETGICEVCRWCRRFTKHQRCQQVYVRWVRWYLKPT